MADSKVSNGHSEIKRERSERRDKYQMPKRREREYNDERRPVDLGREAKPYPTGLSSSSSSYRLLLKHLHMISNPILMHLFLQR